MVDRCLVWVNSCPALWVNYTPAVTVVQRGGQLHLSDGKSAECGLQGRFPKRMGRPDQLGQQS